jgi:hypothetical protein
MRVLRWEEIQDFFREIHARAVAAKDHRAEPCARGILDAYEDHWDGAEEEPYRQLDAHRQTASEQVAAPNRSLTPNPKLEFPVRGSEG